MSSFMGKFFKLQDPQFSAEHICCRSNHEGWHTLKLFYVFERPNLAWKGWQVIPPKEGWSEDRESVQIPERMFLKANVFHPPHMELPCSAVLILAASLTLSARGTDALPAGSQNQADALLAQMTLDEKIGQMVQVDSGALVTEGDVQKYFLGSVLSGGSSDPAAGNSAQSWLDSVNGFKNQALQTRLKIPLIYGIDAVHGHNNIDGAVIFPHHIGMGATRDPQLVERAEHVTAEEVAGTGIRWAFAPCIAVAQDAH